MRKYTTIIFDLDGTLINTLTDLTNSVNFVLREMNLSERTIDEIRTFVGNGVKQLVYLAVSTAMIEVGKPKPSDEMIDRALAIFKGHYALHCQDTTKPYDGIYDLLKSLKDLNYKMAIVSNKPQQGVDILKKQFFDEYIDVAIGEDEAHGISKKPAPDMVFRAIELLNETSENCIYIGDSEVDFATAKNAGLICISVLWGFRSEEFLRKQGAKIFAKCPNDVLNFV